MVLFTAVLAIASKFSQPQLYPKLLQNANDAIRTAILEPIYHIGVVQAICILVCSCFVFSCLEILGDKLRHVVQIGNKQLTIRVG
jgi:hypothetical protein